VLPCYARLNTHHFYLLLNFIRKKCTRHKTGSASVLVLKFCHGTRSETVHIRKKILWIWISDVCYPSVCYSVRDSAFTQHLWAPARSGKSLSLRHRRLHSVADCGGRKGIQSTCKRHESRVTIRFRFAGEAGNSLFAALTLHIDTSVDASSVHVAFVGL